MGGGTQILVMYTCVNKGFQDLDRLKSLQHKAIKLIFSANRFDSPAPLMNTLHWLPIRERINFKICMYVFKCIHGNAPKYLSDFISHRLRPVTGPITRSSNDSVPIVAHVERNCIGDKSFYVIAPRLWNALPRNIREAKSLVFKKDVEVSPLSKILTCFVFLFCFVFPPLQFDLDGKVCYKCLYVCMYVCKTYPIEICSFEENTPKQKFCMFHWHPILPLKKILFGTHFVKYRSSKKWPPKNAK